MRAAACALVVLAATPAFAQVEVSGPMLAWHPVTIDVIGPEMSEDGDPNPFTDTALWVTVTCKGERVGARFPGYFAADGNAGETGATSGNVWRAHFMPGRPGEYTLTVDHRLGDGIALEYEPEGGEPLPAHGEQASLSVESCPPGIPRERGRLIPANRWSGPTLPRVLDEGDWWPFLKGGADSPENFLGYEGFDQTPPTHRYEPHVGDWREGDPTWQGGKGQGIIGALNYLADQGMNSVYMLTMNVGGDGKDVWPWTSDDERFRFDCSKLDQWNIVFDHMDDLGLMMHFVTQETENDQLLDGGELGPERILYYRELIARFAHHLAVTWNLGEENTNTHEQRLAFARFFEQWDRYGHTTVAHTYPGAYNEVYRPLLGIAAFDGVSLQMGDMTQTHAETVKWVELSDRVGRHWVVCLDEIGPASTGVMPDAEDPTHDQVRKHALWGNLMGGGHGVEWYMGYQYAHNDLNAEDWRSRHEMWRQTKVALDIFRALPLGPMEPADWVTPTEGAWCLANIGELYLLYLPDGGEAALDLGGLEYEYSVEWIDPMSGERHGGEVPSVQGPGVVDLGSPPMRPENDWAVLVSVTGPVPVAQYMFVLDVPILDEAAVYPKAPRISACHVPGARVKIAAPLPRPGFRFAGWSDEGAPVEDPSSEITFATLTKDWLQFVPTYEKGDPIYRAAVVRLELVDAATGEVLAELSAGSELNLSQYPGRDLAVVAVTEPQTVGSVRCIVNGETVQTESQSPYSLTGDQGGTHNPWEPEPGDYLIEAVPFRESGGQGLQGQPLSVGVHVVE